MAHVGISLLHTRNAVARDDSVVGKHRPAFFQRLRDDHAIKGVAMMKWPLDHTKTVGWHAGQQLNSSGTAALWNAVTGP